MIYAQGMGMPVAVGTPRDIADQMEHYMDDGGADGFMLVATYTPGCFEEFTVSSCRSCRDADDFGRNMRAQRFEKICLRINEAAFGRLKTTSSTPV